MASVQSILLEKILTTINIKNSIAKAFESGKFNKNDTPEPPSGLYANLDIVKSSASGRNLFTLKPKGGGTGTHILFLHGGAYVQGFNRIHWSFLNTIIQKTGSTVIAPDYPLAPYDTYKESYEMVIPIYEDLIRRAGGDRVILMGDSSGGGFALALAQRMKVENTAQPSQIILISPWLDLTLTNPEIDNISPIDPILSIRGLQSAARAYAGGDDPKSFLLSPINGPLVGLGKISIFIGSKDLLEPDTRKIVEIAKGKGTDINYYDYRNMIHDWVLLNIPESKEAIDQIVGLINSNILAD